MNIYKALGAFGVSLSLFLATPAQAFNTENFSTIPSSTRLYDISVSTSFPSTPWSSIEFHVNNDHVKVEDKWKFHFLPSSILPEPIFLEKYSSNLNDLLIKGLEFIGVSYKWGGTTVEEGMDCSGFVKRVFSDSLGIHLPRTAKEMSKVGDHVSFSELKPGDLVFFNTMKKAFSHVGIYMGNNQFLHAPRTGKNVEIATLQEGWIKKFNGARRIIMNNKNS
ncbi:MAG TPA: C40 family peptidase [Ignavibacteriaceae bacterium]